MIQDYGEKVGNCLGTHTLLLKIYPDAHYIHYIPLYLEQSLISLGSWMHYPYCRSKAGAPRHPKHLPVCRSYWEQSGETGTHY